MYNKSMNSYEKRVRTVLEQHKFVLDGNNIETFKERLNNDRRYFYMVLPRMEVDTYGNRQRVHRFLKIPRDDSRKLLMPFGRQIEVARFLKEHDIILTRGIIAWNMDPKKGIPFAIMETLPQARIGFIHGYREMESLTERHAENVLKALFKFHTITIDDLPRRIVGNLKKFKHTKGYIRREMRKVLRTRVSPIDFSKKTYFHEVLEKRVAMSNVRRHVLELLQKIEPHIFTKGNRIKTLVHGDMAPNNLYVYDNDDIELLDLEWVGICKNRALAVVFDFGNLRARAWNNKVFRESLDQILLRDYAERGQAELGKAIVSLSILRSHIQLSRYFEDYHKEKQILEEEKSRKESTEKDILKAWQIMGISIN